MRFPFTHAEGVDYWRIAAPQAGVPGPLAGGIARLPDFMPKGWLPYSRVASIEDCVAAARRLSGKVVHEEASP